MTIMLALPKNAATAAPLIRAAHKERDSKWVRRTWNIDGMIADALQKACLSKMAEQTLSITRQRD